MFHRSQAYNFNSKEYWDNVVCPRCRKSQRQPDEYGFWSCPRCDKSVASTDYSLAEKKRVDTWGVLHGRKNSDSN